MSENKRVSVLHLFNTTDLFSIHHLFNTTERVPSYKEDYVCSPHYTIVDIFDTETCLQSPFGIELDKHFPTCITLIILAYSNAEPPKNIPVPKHLLLDTKYNIFKRENTNPILLDTKYNRFKRENTNPNRIDVMIWRTEYIHYPDNREVQVKWLSLELIDNFNKFEVVNKIYNEKCCFDWTHKMPHHCHETGKIADVSNYLLEECRKRFGFDIKLSENDYDISHVKSLYKDPYGLQEIKLTEFHEKNKQAFIYAKVYKRYPRFDIKNAIIHKLTKLNKLHYFSHITSITMNDVYGIANITFGEEPINYIDLSECDSNDVMYKIDCNTSHYTRPLNVYDCRMNSERFAYFESEDVYTIPNQMCEATWCNIPVYTEKKLKKDYKTNYDDTMPVYIYVSSLLVNNTLFIHCESI